MLEYYVTAFRKYAVFSGRARRREYWYFALTNFLVLLVLMFIGALGGTEQQPGQIGSFAAIVYVLYIVAMIVPAIAVNVRRLHDIGKSGWWVFIGLVPIIGPIWLIILHATDGQPGDNQYGTDPKTAAYAFEKTTA
jgi:uncharacterized membrane protein YhaH (DUF805 family)